MKKFATIILTCVALVFGLIIVTSWANNDGPVKNYSEPVENRLTQKPPFEERRERLINGDKVKPVWQEQPSPPAELKVEGLAEEKNNVAVKPSTNPDKQSVVVVFHEDDLKRVVVISNNGQWIADAKELEISVGPYKAPSLKCTMYKGSFRPSTPEIKQWNIDKILVATDSQFQTVVDSLNEGKLPTF